MDEKCWSQAAAIEDVPPGKSKAVNISGKSILLCHDDRIYAVENQCSHAHEALDCGRIKHGWVACPVHGARFDLETGEAINPPATEPIATFPVRIVDGIIEVAI
ncbi:MAG TPA: non-heme iron oxygenase ferredoxin subunit [Sphingobium sp.]|nr:non-heme iron oxygenase ferredoxin subunit [Sphingobium sp.]